MIPPNIKANWDENAPFMQAMLIAYEQIRSIEESESATSMMKAMAGV